jgi:hypothetical protein
MPIKAVATPLAREAAKRVCAAQADARAVALTPVIVEIRASGITTPYAIAAALTARGIPTARGHRFWGTEPVRKLLHRLDRLSASGTLGSQIERQESSPPKRNKGKPKSRKGLLSRSEAALQELPNPPPRYVNCALVHPFGHQPHQDASSSRRRCRCCRRHGTRRSPRQASAFGRRGSKNFSRSMSTTTP